MNYLRIIPKGVHSIGEYLPKPVRKNERTRVPLHYLNVEKVFSQSILGDFDYIALFNY